MAVWDLFGQSGARSGDRGDACRTCSIASSACCLARSIGVLPGIGPVATIAMLLPITYALPPTAALIMLAGIYYGAQYGGSTTAILVNLPGEASSVVTCLDGYQMARQGRAGPALAIAAIGSFVAGTVATLICALLAAPLAAVATQFGPAEYFSLMVLGLIGAVVIANRSMMKAIGMVACRADPGPRRHRREQRRAALHLRGDGTARRHRFHRRGGRRVRRDGDREQSREEGDARGFHRQGRQPDAEPRRLQQSAMPIARGTLVGSVLGILPAGGALLASFAAYAVEKKVAKDPSRFGKGAIEGVAGPGGRQQCGRADLVHSRC